jgi:hypothetical protein
MARPKPTPKGLLVENGIIKGGQHLCRYTWAIVGYRYGDILGGI